MYGIKGKFIHSFQLEDSDRKRIENIKQTEISKATEELERWKEQQKQMAKEVTISRASVLGNS